MRYKVSPNFEKKMQKMTETEVHIAFIDEIVLNEH